MSPLLRRLAPAAVLGSLAVIVVGLLDPALHPSRALANGGQAAVGAGTAAAARSTGSCATAKTVTGPVVDTQYGPVQVQATVNGRQLCAVKAVQWPQNDGRSSMINSYAIPQLDAQASQQGVNFDGVSGATYTTDGYRQSLQAIVDSL